MNKKEWYTYWRLIRELKNMDKDVFKNEGKIEIALEILIKRDQKQQPSNGISFQYRRF